MNLLRYLPESWKVSLRRRAGVVTQHDRLQNLRGAGFEPTHILDGGAYRGEWAAMARSVFPGAQLLLVEPQPSLQAGLQARCRQFGRAAVAPVALGRTPGEATFLLEETNSRIVGGPDRTTAAPDRITVPVGTLAELLPAHGFTARSLLKLDLQGGELEALAGAGEWFGKCEVILAEVSWLRIGPVPLIGEVLAALAERGYVPYDIFGQNYRPLDRALWQTDLLFVRHDSALIKNSSWA